MNRIGAFLRDCRKLRDPDSNGPRSSKLLSILRKKKKREQRPTKRAVSVLRRDGFVYGKLSRWMHDAQAVGKWILPTTRRFHPLYMRPNKEFISYRFHVVSMYYIPARVVAFIVWRLLYLCNEKYIHASRNLLLNYNITTEE